MRTVEQLKYSWEYDERWRGITRPYSAEDVIRLRGLSVPYFTRAHKSAQKLWTLFETEPYVASFGAVTGMQAVQMVRAGLKAIYCSGWQVAGDNNDVNETYPDQSLYTADSVPRLVKRINNAFAREDQKQTAAGKYDKDWFAPIIADAEAGFGGVLNVFELMKWMIEAGAAGVHLEDQLSSAKKCGHLGGKVVVPTGEFIKKLVAARLAADILDVPTILIARTDANSATLLANDIDERDRPFITSGELRTEEGFFRVHSGIEAAIARGLSYAPYADMLWCETSKPDLAEARKFAEAIDKQFPHKLLAYNCSPSFNWKKNLDDTTIAKFQTELGAMGYKFQFITLAGFHLINYYAFEFAKAYAQKGMSAYIELQEKEFATEKNGYTAVRHQTEVGTDYFDAVVQVISKNTSTLAMNDSTEKEQFSK